MRQRQLFGVVYLCSGAAALVYEIAWTRLLTLHMGHTVGAASIVLAAFMGGLAIGAWLTGGPAARLVGAHPMRAYATLELLVAGAALSVPTLLSACTPLLAWAYADASATLRFTLVRAVVGACLVGMPAVAMGATVPIAASWAARREGAKSAVGAAGVLYALNTAGAAIGAVAAGFWLLPATGLRATTWCGVALNVVAAGGALWIGRRDETAAAIGSASREPSGRLDGSEAPAATKPKSAAPSRPQAVASQPRPGLACAAAAVSGFVALVYEVAWTRLLALIIGPTTYAFATMASAFIAGLAIGSAVGARIVRRSPDPGMWLAAALACGAVAANVAAWLAASEFPRLMIATVARSPQFDVLVLQHAFIIAVLLVPMTFALGAAFPLALGVASQGAATVGRDAARVYVSNTTAAVAGALCGGFLLLPYLGLRSAFQVVGIVSAIAGAVCLWIATPSQSKDQRALGLTRAAALAAGAIAVIVLLPQWDRTLLASGPYTDAAGLTYGDPDADAMLRAGRIEYYKEGAGGTVLVRRVAGIRTLSIDGKVDAGSSSDLPTQRLLGLLPVLMHRAPDDLLVVGLGSGVTVASALAPGTVRHADVVEISPEVVAASRFFRRENKDVLTAPAVRLVVGDGRSHLALTTRRYDVIVSEPSNPWMAGVAALFTREYLEAARAHLKPGGLLCQWAHTYHMKGEDLRSIVLTFTSVFPESSMWMVGEGDVMLIGTTGPSLNEHLDTLARQSTEARASAGLAEMSIPSASAPFALLSLLVGGPSDLARYAHEAPIQTDDRMALEFSAPRALYEETTRENVKELRALAASAEKPAVVKDAFDKATPADWWVRGTVEFDETAFALAFEAFQRAVTLDSRSTEWLRSFWTAAAHDGKVADARAWFRARMAAEPDNAAPRAELSILEISNGNSGAAVQLAVEAWRLAPDDPHVVNDVVTVLAAAGDTAVIVQVADAFLAKFPDLPDARFSHALSLKMRGRAGEAIDEARRVVQADPRHARAQDLLGMTCLGLGQNDCARTALEAALEAEPKDIVPYLRLGELHLRLSQPEIALDYFAQALFFNRASGTARQGLKNARAALAGPR